MVRQSLFWVQQGAEKALKAFLIGNGRQYPMTHDLNRLRVLCSAVDSAIDPSAMECLGLTLFAGLGRYPGESHLPSPEEAQELLDAAWSLHSFVAGRLGIVIE
jgi:HEPN domain-containing protein